MNHRYRGVEQRYISVENASIRIVVSDTKQALSRSGLPDLDYALNPYLGCAHRCVYCYARRYFEDLYRGNVVVVRSSIHRVLANEVRYVSRGVVGVGTVTDPYQPIEADLELTRRCLEILIERSRLSVSIQTKSSLVLRDLDLLAMARGRVDVGFTITSLDQRMKIFEPYAPPPKERVRALEKLASEGVKTWIFYGPVIPGINDDDDTIRSLVELAQETNSVLYYDKLHIKPFMEHVPMLRNVVEEVRRYPWRKLFEFIEEMCRRYGVVCRPGFIGDAVEKPRRTLDQYIR